MAPAPSGAAVLGTIYTLIVLAALVIAARIYLRIVIQKRRLLASDFIMILAWLSAVTTSSFDILLKKHGALEAHINYTLTNYEADLRQAGKGRISSWVGDDQRIPAVVCFCISRWLSSHYFCALNG
ncbi:hypothetical protein NCS56_00659900 [Fusarium sp. Ph1]|nr:hypothetical protein NCS56_00659900 [Fusarium sp. Ph1]